MKKYLLLSYLSTLFIITGCGADLSSNGFAKDGFLAIASQDQETVCPISDKTPEKISIDTKIDAPYLDYSREIKDFGTNLVVKEFFSTKDTLFNFLKLTYESIDDAIREYRHTKGLEDRAISFIFKGGNVMRLIANKVFSMVPEQVRDLLEKHYAEYFKRSDSDFSILVDESKLGELDYETVMNDMLNLTYQKLNDLRDEFNKNPGKYFNFLRLDANEANISMRKNFDSLKEVEAITEPENENWYKANFLQFQLLNNKASDMTCSYEGNFDYRYEYDKDQKDKIIGIPLTDKTNWISNSINQTLTWSLPNDPNKLIKFYLVRAKIQFEYTFSKDGLHRKPIGAELIDVSLPHKDDFRSKLFFENYDRLIADYIIVGDDPNQLLNMKSESITGIAEDLFQVLFDQFSRPWEASKYEKRIGRLFFFGIVQMLGSYGSGSHQVKDYLAQVNKQIIEPLSQLYPINPDEANNTIKQVSDSLSYLVNEFSSLAAANLVWSGFIRTTKELVEHPKDDDEENYKKFLEQIKNNLNIIEQITDMEHQIIDLNEINKVSVDQLL